MLFRSQRLKAVYPEFSCEQSVIQFERKLGANSLAFLFSKRADGVYTKEIYQKFYQESKRGSLYKMVALIILSFNPRFCQKIRTIKRYVKSLNKVSFMELS